MNDGVREPASAWLRTIGPEPEGATPISEEDLDGLIPTFVATRADLNQVEYENIARALPWALEQARVRGTLEILEFGFVFELHRRMFGDVWTWAGTQRRRETNIGVAPQQIVIQTKSTIDDARYWHEHDVFSSDERAVRIHHRLVSVHPFPNGNGRGTRLFADLYMTSIGRPPLSWGRSRLDEQSEVRSAYIAALERAGDGDYTALLRFARS